MEKARKKKNYYAVGEKVFIKRDARTVADGFTTGVIKSMNIPTYDAILELENGKLVSLKFWQIRKYRPTRTLSFPRKPLHIKVKYLTEIDDVFQPITKSEKGDWIDLRASQTVTLKAGESALIPLGVAMQLPPGYEAIVAPRSSTYKNWGIRQTNSIGVIDNSYQGDNDEWKLPVVADRDTTINRGDRICQFRIIRSMPKVNIITVDTLNTVDRGGFGSTGTN